MKVNGDFETGEERAVLGIIPIRGGDLLIAGSRGFTENIFRQMGTKTTCVDMENKATYSGM